MKFQENLSSGAELFHAERRKDGQTHRHNEAKSRFSKFCGRAQKADNVLKIIQLNDRPKIEFLKNASQI